MEAKLGVGVVRIGTRRLDWTGAEYEKTNKTMK